MAFSYRYHDQASTPTIEENAGRIRIEFDEVYDSPSVGYTIYSTNDVALERLVATLWTGFGKASYRYYFSEVAPLYAYGAVQGAASTNLPQPGVELRSGIGYGRFRDVTPLAKALRIAERLASSKAVPSELSSSDIDAIAQVIARRSEFDTTAELVAAIAAGIDGAASGSLDARALIAIEDIVSQTSDSRFCGGMVQGGVGYELLDANAQEHDTIYVLSGDFAYAPSPALQLRAMVSFSSPTDLRFDTALTGRFLFDAMIGDSRSMSAEYSIERLRQASLSVRVQQSISLDYAISLGRLAINLGASASRVPAHPGWTTELSLGASFDLL